MLDWGGAADEAGVLAFLVGEKGFSEARSASCVCVCVCVRACGCGRASARARFYVCVCERERERGFSEARSVFVGGG